MNAWAAALAALAWSVSQRKKREAAAPTPSSTPEAMPANAEASWDDLVPVDTLFALWPLGSGRFWPWQVLSYGFLHGGMFHLFFNMLGLWMFGAELERIWGGKRYLQFYFASVLTAALTQLLVEVVTVMLMMLALHWLPPTGLAADPPRPASSTSLTSASDGSAAALPPMPGTRPRR